MSSAILLAAVASALASGGIVELATAASVTRVSTPGRRLSRRRADDPDITRRVPAGVAVLARLGRRLGSPAAPRHLEAKLAAAGVAPRIGAADVMAAKGGAALVGFLAAIPVAVTLPGGLALALAAAAPCAGFLAPDVWLRHRTHARQRTIGAELPDVLDLLRVAVEAGLPVARALGEVGRRRRGLLAAELRTAAARIELGVPRAEAISILVARCPADGMVALAAALERAERHGAPLAAALAAVAAGARAERARVVTERAARAAPQMQLVVALLLVPAVMLLLAAALLAAPGR